MPCPARARSEVFGLFGGLKATLIEGGGQNSGLKGADLRPEMAEFLHQKECFHLRLNFLKVASTLNDGRNYQIGPTFKNRSNAFKCDRSLSRC